MDRPAPMVSVQALRVLLLEDSALDAELVTETMNESGLNAHVERVASSRDFERAIRDGSWDLILADYILPGYDGLAALAHARTACPATPFVFVSGALGEEVAVEALKQGATDYVLKQRLERLPGIVSRALLEARERRERRAAEAALHQLLEERTALLHELDHRVKNNLQLLLSLLGIEIRQADDDGTRHVLSRMRDRLQALAAAHRDLYSGEGPTRFNAARFAKGLCEELTASLQGTAVVVDCDLAHVEVPASRAAPLALLFNEIASNVIAHAYRTRHGRMTLAMTVDDGVLSVVMKDTALQPEERNAAREAASNTVLKALARQLDATIEWPEDESSTLVRVMMPIQEASLR